MEGLKTPSLRRTVQAEQIRPHIAIRQTDLHHTERGKCKTTAHGSGIDYVIRQEALPATSTEQMENTAYRKVWR
jgi:hypothetical protein